MQALPHLLRPVVRGPPQLCPYRGLRLDLYRPLGSIVPGLLALRFALLGPLALLPATLTMSQIRCDQGVFWGCALSCPSCACCVWTCGWV